MFYRAYIESVLTFSFLGWFGSLSVKNKTVLARVVNVCSKIVGERQASLNELYESRAVRKGRKIEGDSAQILARHYELLPSGRRYRMPRTRTLRAQFQQKLECSVCFLNDVEGITKHILNYIWAIMS